MNYKDIIDNEEKSSSVVDESSFLYAVDTIEAVNSKYEFMRDFVRANYSKEESDAIESRNFMIGTPFSFDKAEAESDWEQIEQEAEASGVASAETVDKVFSRWHNL